MTNGDAVRNMTNEELADFLMSKGAKACELCDYNDSYYGCKHQIVCTKEHVRSVYINWLSTEAFSERSERG